MATTVYKTGLITLMDGTELELSPLKIKHLRYFMDKFENVKSAQDDIEAIEALSDCAQICMKQFKPEIAISKEIFDETSSSMVVSGTLEPTEMYQDLLGIENTMLRSYKNPFPEENSLNLIVPITTTKYDRRSNEVHI